MDKTWKAAERKIASLLGGTRIPVTGRQRGDAADIDHEWLSIEVKHRKSAIPKWQQEAMSQAQASCRQGQLPIVVLHVAGTEYVDSIVQIKLSDFRRWFL